LAATEATDGLNNIGSPVVHTLNEKPENDEEEVMVKTEFVWADGADDDVKLSGAWNGWMPIQMYHEGGGMWSVVTPVPAGKHEFKFVVDGVWRHSTRHPTVGEDNGTQNTINNIRVIRGPPRTKETGDEKKSTENGPKENADGGKGCCVTV
jgi:hypothetical protein